MAQTFSGKLFRQFLVFSLIPTLAMALAGYFVASQTADHSERQESLPSVIPASYFNDLLYDRIEKGLATWQSDSASIPLILDFLIVFPGAGGPSIPVAGSLSSSTLGEIAVAVQERPRGIIHVDSLVIQYSSGHGNGGANICGGLIHGPGYSYLIESIQSDYASRSLRREMQNNFTLFLAAMFLILSSATVVLSYYFSRRTARGLAAPLQRLSQASNRIARGDFAQSVQPSGEGEIRTLIENFNHMASQLERTTARLAQSERVAAWRNVARRFAHELKNPLQPVLVSLYRIRKMLGDTSISEQVEEPLNAATEEIKHLTDLAERFSSLAKLPEPKPERANMNELLASIAELYRELLTGSAFSLELPTEIVHCRIDTSYFRDAIHNLLKNAVEATDAGGIIELSLEVSDAVHIRIKDNGAGMTPEILDQARMPYFSTKDSGSGIGLAVVEKIVGELGGQLSITSSPESGTTIEISLMRED